MADGGAVDDVGHEPWAAVSQKPRSIRLAMIHRASGAISLFALSVLLTLTATSPAVAANKEHQQLAADIRMLQEQAQQLQNLLATLNEALKAVNARIDEQTNASRKSVADEKVLIDNLTTDVRVVREKVDDNNVRISSLTQDLEQLRQMMQAGTRPPDAAPGPGTAPGSSQPPSDASAGTPPAPAASAIGASPTRLYDMAWSDYASGQWDLAIQGFDSYIRSFPRSDQADDAQVNIGAACMMQGNYEQAVEAFDQAIRNYPNGDKIPDAYYRKGLALRSLKRNDQAREAFDHVVKAAPDSDAGRLAKQALEQLGK
jgi:tol-pal system protein YbgF